MYKIYKPIMVRTSPKTTLLNMKIIATTLMLFAVISCQSMFIGINKIIVDQGNVISQSMMNDIEMGMTKRQVQYVLGTPLTESPFDRDIWIYYYSAHKISETKKIQTNTIKLFFADGELLRVEGDLKPQDTEEKRLLRESESIGEADNSQQQ